MDAASTVEEDPVRRAIFAETFPVTSFLLLFILALYALELVAEWRLTGEFPQLIGGGPGGRVTRLLGSLGYAEVRHGHEYWRVISSGFLHGGFWHILMNGFVLWDLGRFCEPLLSSWKFLVVYVASLIGGALASLGYSAVVLEPEEAALRHSVGASGALCGLIGVLLVYSIRLRIQEMRDALLRWVVWIVLFSYLIRNVDHAGHAGGFAAGCAFGLTVDSYIGSRQAARWRVPGIAAGLLVVACLGLAIAHYLRNR